MDLRYDGNEILRNIKSAYFFPYKTGHLRDDATSGDMFNSTTYLIKFDGDIAPYIEYLEEGTKPHDIPFAFIGKGNWKWWYPFGDGVPFLFGMGGRFNGKFHPGSTKHKNFIKDKTIDMILMYFITKYKGEVK